MRKITKADAIKDKKASTRAATREIVGSMVIIPSKSVKRQWRRQQLNAAEFKSSC